ncbi:glycosyltransferase family 4 protein [Paenibacillus dokdonensis]|uniref:glycosyltransferase family 4 protein n=1 Tax=Paenibacillus dokdonensis TaxID=2567944 RepID=UPI001FEAEB81|nr:glycosyltransferase family 4 protein [Paenibacillus dokdonensis]
MRLKILIVAPEQIPVPGTGSVEICILAISKKLAEHHQVTVVSRASGNLASHSKVVDGVNIFRVASGSSKVYLSSVLRFLRNKNYDLIQVDNRPHYMAAIKKARPNTKVTLFLHSLTFVPKAQSVQNSLNHADIIIANSSSLKSKLTNRFPTQAHKIRTVELGVDVNRFRPPSESERTILRAKYTIGKTFTILFVGRVIPRKGVPVLLKATHLANQQVPVHLVIAGKGKDSYMKKLREQASKLGIPVSWIGKKKHSEIHKIYQIADCFVCPSQKHEAFGLVNVEAMATGLPVIASRIGGIPEIVKHGNNGYLIDKYHDPAQFAEYLVRLGKNKELVRTLGDHARTNVLSQFTWRQTATRLETIYR